MPRFPKLPSNLRAWLACGYLSGCSATKNVLCRSFVTRSRHNVSLEYQAEFTTIDSLAKIDKKNDMQMQVLHKYMQHNTLVINFWLEHVAIPKHAKVFPENLRKTAWHMTETSTGKARSTSTLYTMMQALWHGPRCIICSGKCE